MSKKTDEFFSDWAVFWVMLYVCLAIPVIGFWVSLFFIEYGDPAIAFLLVIGILALVCVILAFFMAVYEAIEWNKTQRIYHKIKKIKKKKRAAERKISDKKDDQKLRIEYTEELALLRMTAKRKCSHCGTPIPKRDKFCSSCGTFL